MITCNKSNVARASSQSQSPQYLSIGKAAKLLGVSPQTLRAYEKQGRLVSYRTIGNQHGHRRYERAELLSQAIGVQSDEQKGNEEKRVCIYIRVSSVGQSRSGSLQRQLERMLAVVAEREGIDQSAIVIFKDVASSFSDRPGVNAMIDAIVGGKVKKIFTEHQDRLSRIPGTLALINHLCKSHGVVLIAIDREEQQLDEQAAGLADLIDFVTILSNRASGRKSALLTRQVLGPDAMQFVRESIASGRSIAMTADLAKTAGLRTEQGKEISCRVIGRVINKVVQKLVPLGEIENSFETFVSQHLHKKKSDKHKVQGSAVHVAYGLYSKSRGIAPLSARKCGAWLRAHGFTSTLIRSYTFYNDCELIGYASVLDARGKEAQSFANGIEPQKYHYAGSRSRDARKPKWA